MVRCFKEIKDSGKEKKEKKGSQHYINDSFDDRRMVCNDVSKISGSAEQDLQSEHDFIL